MFRKNENKIMNCVPTGCMSARHAWVPGERGSQGYHHAPKGHQSAGIEDVFLCSSAGPVFFPHTDQEVTEVPLRSITALT
jgi:hypothetical protein